MDPEKRIKELEAELAAEKSKVTTLETEKAQLVKDNEGLQQTITEKDELIEQKNQDIIGARRKYKPLKEMTDEEKAQLSEEDIKRKEEQDELYERQEAIEKEKAEERKAEQQSRLNKAIDRYANGDKELADKIRNNYSKLRGSDKAHLEEEIAELVDVSVRMMGPDAPDPVRTAHNDRGGAPGSGAEESFADTQDGKELASAMGLSVEPPQGTN